jgi:hypothetical protein
MFKKKAICQSCSMPLTRDPEGGGTNADGTLSVEYCSFCYKDGAFINPGITAQEMVEKVKEQLKEYRIPSILRTHFTRSIPKLNRWKTKA